MMNLADLLADLDAKVVTVRPLDAGIAANQVSCEDGIRLVRGGLAEAMQDITARHVVRDGNGIFSGASAESSTNRAA